MCEQTEVDYKEGEVVWVKLGSCWWPGKVREVDKLPEDILESFRKKPIAAVQFFDEDKYEYVKNLDQICMYNCRRKHDFIRKGLDMYRAKQREGSSFMDKFPCDVSKAELYTGGNPDIITDNTFAPEEKPNYRSIFGTDKKVPDKKTPDKKHRSSNSSMRDPARTWQMKLPSANGRRSLPNLPIARPITHPRIIKMLKGEADHEVRIRQQPIPCNLKETPPSEPYKCYRCQFTSHRLNVIIMHSKSHTVNVSTASSGKRSGGSRSSTSSANSKSRNRSRMSSAGDGPKSHSQIASLDMPETPKSSGPSQYSRNSRSKLVESLEKTDGNSISHTPQTVEKKSPKMPIFGKRKGSKGATDKTAKKKKPSEDFKERLLADWGDEDTEAEQKEMEKLQQELSRSDLFSTSSSSTTAVELNDSTNQMSSTTTVKPKEMSCFDFDEKADAILDRELEERAKKFAEARKFPRFTEEKVDTGLKRDELKIIAIHDKSENESLVHERESECATNEKDDADKDKELAATFNALMAETELPNIPEIPNEKTKPVCTTLVEDNSQALNMSVVDNAISRDRDHDYVSVQRDVPPVSIVELVEESGEKTEVSMSEVTLDDEEMDLDINSMPVVMDDTVITEETHTKLVNDNVSCVSLASTSVTIPPHVSVPSPATPKSASLSTSVAVSAQGPLTSVATTASVLSPIVTSAPASVTPLSSPPISSASSNATPADSAILIPTTVSTSSCPTSASASTLVLSPTPVSPCSPGSNSESSPTSDPFLVPDPAPVLDSPSTSVDTTLTSDHIPVCGPTTVPTVPSVSMPTSSSITPSISVPIPEPPLVAASSPELDVACIDIPAVGDNKEAVTDEVTPEENGKQEVELVETSKNVQVCTSGSSTVVKVLKPAVKTVKLHTGSPVSSGNLKATEGATIVAQKGSVGGKLVLIHPASSSGQSFYTSGKPLQQCLTVKAMPHSSQQQMGQQPVSKKLVIVKSSQGNVQQEVLTSALPQQQGILTSSGSVSIPQCVIKSQGTILKQMPGKTVMGRGTKLVSLTQEQMKALAASGKQTLGTKLTMQSSQTKVVLPTMQPKLEMQQSSSVKVIRTGVKPKANTILIQTTQGTSNSGSSIPKAATTAICTLTTSMQPNVLQTVVRQTVPRPKLIATSSSGSTLQRVLVGTAGSGAICNVQVQNKTPGAKTTLQPRMLLQKVRTTMQGKASNVGVVSNVHQVKRVSGIYPRAQLLQKTGQIQKTPSIQKIIPVQPKTSEMDVTVSKTAVTSPAHATETTQSLPVFQPIQPDVTVAPTIQQSFQSDSIVLSTAQSATSAHTPSVQTSALALPAVTSSSSLLTQEQIAQVMASAPTEHLSDGATATYVLVTIDEAASLQSYDNSTLIYDGTSQNNDSNTRTLYIDPSSLGTSSDLENIILTINNPTSGSGTILNLGQSNTVSRTSTSAAQNSSPLFRTTGSAQSSSSASSCGSSQDILAAALANTDVFQPEVSVQDSLTVVNSSQSASGSVMTSRLLESTPLLVSSSSTPLHQATMLLPSLATVLPPANVVPPANAAGVLETSLTLSQPIMTPLEVPSSVTNLPPPPPVIPTSLELPLTITQPALSIPSLSLPSNLHTSDSPVSSSNIAHTVSKSLPAPVSTFHPSMPLLSEEVTESHVSSNESGSLPTASASSSPDSPQTNLKSKTESTNSFEQISESTTHVSETESEKEKLSSQASSKQSLLPSYAQVPEISSHLVDEGIATNPNIGQVVSNPRSFHDVPESTSETVTGMEPSQTQSASEQTVSTSYNQIPKDGIPKGSPEMIDSSLNRPTSPACVPSALETTSEAVAVKDPTSESQDCAAAEPSIPYDQVESTSQLPENTPQNDLPTEIDLEPPSHSDSQQSFSQTPESTSSVPEDIAEEGSTSDILTSNPSKQYALPSYSQVPESTCELQDDKHTLITQVISDSYSQIPESTSQTPETQAARESTQSLVAYGQLPESSSEATVVGYDEPRPVLDVTTINNFNQVPESTSQIHDMLSFSDSSTDCLAPASQSMPLLDETGDHTTTAVKRSLEIDDSEITVKMLKQGDER